MSRVTHEQIIRCLREFADELESRSPANTPQVYQTGGATEQLFECGLWIRAEITDENCLSRVGNQSEAVKRIPGVRFINSSK